MFCRCRCSGMGVWKVLHEEPRGGDSSWLDMGIDLSFCVCVRLRVQVQACQAGGGKPYRDTAAASGRMPPSSPPLVLMV